MKRVTLVLMCGLMASACNPDAAAEDQPINLDAIDANAEAGLSTAIPEAPPEPVVPIAPHYAEEENGIYSYFAAVSEEDRKRGLAAGNVVLLAFRGVSKGVYRIDQVDELGRTKDENLCGRPCRVIKSKSRMPFSTATRMQFTSDSIIGAAFDDAFNGRLKATAEPDPRSFYPKGSMFNRGGSSTDTSSDSSDDGNYSIDVTNVVMDDAAANAEGI